MNITEFIARVRQAGQISDYDTDFTDTEILKEATNALEDHYPTSIVTMRSGYWLHRSVTNTIVGQRHYPMPSRAVANGLEKVELSVDGGSTYVPLTIMTDYQASDWATAEVGVPINYSFEADEVLLYPLPGSSAYKLRFSFYLHPPTLTTAVTGGTVATVSGSLGNAITLTFSDGAPAFVTSSGTVDILHTSGSGEAALLDVSYTNSPFVLTAGADPSYIRVGDVIRSPQTSDVIPLPKGLHRSLVDYTAAVIANEKGDFDKATSLAGKAENAIKKFLDVAMPRTKANPYLFRTRNTYLRRRIGTGGVRGRAY